MTAVARLAWRHLAARPRQTALTVAGVGVGVAVFIFTIAMMDGLVVFFTERLIRVSPTLTVLPERLDGDAARRALEAAAGEDVLGLSRPPVPDERPTIRGATVLAGRLRELPEVAGAAVAAAVPVVLGFGVITEPATLIGIEADREPGVTSLPETAVAGSWDGLLRRREGAVLGIELARRLGAGVGDRLVVVGELGVGRELEVVGVLATGLGGVDESTAFVNLPVAQGTAGWGSDEGSQIRLRTHQLTGLADLGRRVEGITGYRAETWEEAGRASLQLFRTIGLTVYLLTGFVLVVAGLGIANKLTTIILEKEQDIAVLRSYGFSRGTVRAVFVLEGLLLGGAGAVVGCVLAAGVIALLTAYPIRFAAPEDAAVAYTELYLANDPRYYAVIAAAALGIAAVASLLAVGRAVRVVPVEVLRGR